ncbi:MAG TPA: polysaccharide biosynthesis tyrosine autokinase [Flavitalea sp.]|nr:polysaccharide biosynthesis tyrosine autokinase [Flavitalea sp.]
MSENNIDNNKPLKPLMVSPREIFYKYLKYLPWILISIGIAMSIAFIKLRYSAEIFNVSGKLMVKKGTPEMGTEKFDDIFMMQGNNRNLNDEIEIIRSRAMASRVVSALGLQMQFVNKGKIRSSILHPREVPFEFIIEHQADSAAGFTIMLTIVDEKQFRINESPTIYYFNQPVTVPGLTFRLKNKSENNSLAFGSNEFIISLRPLKSAAAGLSGGIRVNQANDYSNVLTLSYETQNPRLGMDIVDRYMIEYKQASLEDKKEIAERTLEFIDEQLDTVKMELGGVERNIQQFQEKNRIYNPEQQVQLFFDKQSETEKEITQQSVQLKVIDYLINHVSASGNKYEKVISSLGIAEPSLVQQISEYNRLQVERETQLKTIPAGNQIIKDIETAIEKLRSDMLANLKNIRQTYVMMMASLTTKTSKSNADINSIPGKGRELLERQRQQSILQELYSYLLQKKLETSIASASTISNIRVIEPAASNGVPISPNRKASYMIAFFLGLLIPVSLAFLKEYMNDKVTSKTDIETVTEAPILGEIGHAENSTTLVVSKNNRKFLAEQFRIIRTNLQYILPKVEKPVLLVTSSFSGEGKSFISTNLGAVVALSGKRTIILEFDIRKPKIMKGLGLNERKGLTNFIIGNVELDAVIHPVPDVENLFVMPCGPVPPNPAEMLLNERVAEMFDRLKERFDTIIIDTAPVGLVSDGITLGAFANAAIYIVRHNYTLKKQIQLINDIYTWKKLPHLSIIINDIEANKGDGGYYSYGQYGYGYGYGYGYFDVEKKKKSLLQKVTGIFK